MSNLKASWYRWSTISLALIGFACLNLPAQGQKEDARGVVEDWSTHHVMFSEPGSPVDALAKGRYNQWLSVQSDERYAMQLRKRHGAPREPDFGGPGKLGKGKSDVSIDRDWSMSLAGATTTGAMGVNSYPAKYSFSTTSASCLNDYVAYATGLAGSGTQATIIGFNNLYATTCGGTTPTVAFAYNTGGTSNLSPVLFWDGQQIAYIQTTASVASLVLLKPSLTSGGTVGSPATIGAAVATSAYRNCAAPCYTTLLLNGSPNVTESSPFYVYNGLDTLYVGDDTGHLHQFIGVFGGTPVEVTTNWPVAASTETTPILASPVYDNTSKLVFVGDATGYLHSVTTTAGAETVRTSSQLDCGTGGLIDAPDVDSTTEEVYAFIGYSCGGTTHTGYINRFAAGTSIAASFGTALALTTSPGTTATLSAGTFDNEYYTTSGVTGNLYVCAFGSLLRIPITTTTTFGTVATYSTPVSGTTTCSPVTEFLGSKFNTTLAVNLGNLATDTTVSVASGSGTANLDYIQIDSEVMHITGGGGSNSLTVTRAQLGTARVAHTSPAAVQDISGDWLYLSVPTLGNVGGCAGPCLYNYNVLNSGTTGTVTTGQAATGGTSGIVVDDSMTATGESQIYYTTQGNATCVGAGGVGAGTHGCAIQASQTLP